MTSSVFRPGATALITGGASGVGLAVAKLCASYGMHLHLVDTNDSLLSSAKSSLSSSSVNVNTHVLDVSSPSSWDTLKAALPSGPDLLHLNAGRSMKGDFSSSSSYFTDTFATNVFGVTNGLSAFLPSITSSSGDQAIIITGSKQGITNPPGNPAYNASKAALRSIAEQLSFSLATTAPHVAVHLLVPGWTFTGLTKAAGATEKPAGAWHPEQVADYMYKKMTEGQFWIICPDNDVSEDLDQRRMLYGGSEVVYGRKPLSRWREESKAGAQKAIEDMKL